MIHTGVDSKVNGTSVRGQYKSTMFAIKVWVACSVAMLKHALEHIP